MNDSSPATRSLRVLMVAPTLGTGGSDAAVVDSVRILRDAGHGVVVVTHGGERAPDVGRLGAEWVQLNTRTINPLVILANVPRLVRIVRERSCDVIHAHGRTAAWSAWLASRIARRPFITTWYKGFREQNPFKRAYNRVMVRGDRVVAVSEQIAELIGERYAVPTQRLSVIPFGIDAMRFDPGGVSPERIDAARRQLGVEKDTRLILVVGRMVRRKGHHVVVEAMTRLKARGLKDFVCVFASEDAGTRYAGELWDLVVEKDASDCVRLSGPLNDVPAAYAAATAVVSASLQEEGLSRGVLEAQAMARPVVVSDLGAGTDVVLAPPSVPEDRATGLRFPANDPNALAAALVKLLAMSDSAREAMGSRGRAWVTASFDPDQVAAQTLELYRSVAAAARA
ncbi:spore coat protein SA [Variibacter gotjawalensis]|uniref:Spore coat protein SA n=1 Tax=Variibacter gotjawalensis TaxID=1333996 RepID=A0A0S3PV76_9BRAD|nr:glycosyltransferase [Variibacter gotjawalensis]NIK50122.1 glycosyltransferase involved in cell wall biosynthesis [Variibacter gotjawalensis]RZS46119.1 glycosyltransferase involved in cell wall biosynthesis [Variibacter gotjawalensis]BAT59795.1 spore coat protein SA [Variibacter gotjawalensis]